ncbi:hypothetical protein KM427_00310 [Nocardioides sp. LMS-CY]|uniref:hypothetical protein n=1 Tax=Nocardioides sp. (strain LMS-CY) TaxID=2840457 RepID=UPI001C00758A|nr:hypothetical protein [Nocardioides sp. LMS-CY]QWF22231.1 hypothetical protein KM427_00310 [Nocardioides sp. LMS-CY]
MAKNPQRRNLRQSDFRVVARGVHRPQPDISRLMRASLEYYLALQEAEQAKTKIVNEERTDEAA